MKYRLFGTPVSPIHAFLSKVLFNHVSLTILTGIHRLVLLTLTEDDLLSACSQRQNEDDVQYTL